MVKMTPEIIVLFVLIFKGVYVNGRVYYVDDSQNNVGIGYDNTNNINDNSEQSSRDLDLSFSSGAELTPENNQREVVVPILTRIHQMQHPYGIPERRYSEINKEIDHPYIAPHSYYKLIEVPETRPPRFEEIIVQPKRNAKFPVRFNGDQKGQVILELRVITNNDAM
ncbi:uncharacterized protein LOC105693344 [Athalia rosae]|uniref:uncharacterized protein LOC105693344 n=1 Tax=Athalia rosae TaxID=37344 RepID=UPI0020340B3B|nr:uncharacterized protein LOC105693344 [Athalia rosae]